jgi:hypothetical protein
MRKSVFLIGALVLGAAAVGFVWSRQRASSIENFVARWALSFEEAESKCRKRSFKARFHCSRWATTAPIYEAEQFSEVEDWLQPACQSGDAVSCSRLRLLTDARQNKESVWLNQSLASGDAGALWPRINALNGVHTSSAWLKYALEGAVAGRSADVDLVCGGLSELPEVLVCTSQGQMKLNRAIGRVVSYVEQGGRVDSFERHIENPLNRFWQGVDLQRADFMRAVDVLRGAGVIDPAEERLWSWLEAQPWKVFLAFNAYSVFTGIPSHEFLHALYFSSQAFQSAVKSTLRPQPAPLQELREFVDVLYRTDNQFITLNEMQAYLLEHDSPFRNEETEGIVDQLIKALPAGMNSQLISTLQKGY